MPEKFRILAAVVNLEEKHIGPVASTAVMAEP